MGSFGVALVEMDRRHVVWAVKETSICVRENKLIP